MLNHMQMGKTGRISSTFHNNISFATILWRHNGRYSVSNHQPHHCLLKSLFRRRSKKTSKLRVTGLCAGNSPVTGEFPAQMVSNAEIVSIWWRHHVCDQRNYCEMVISPLGQDRHSPIGYLYSILYFWWIYACVHNSRGFWLSANLLPWS